MDEFKGGASLPDTSTSLDLQNPTGGAVFDASQYAFFGNNDTVEEVELGGLEEEDDFHPVGFEDEDFQLEREEVEVLDSLSEIDDLASTFSKLNKVVSAHGASGITGSRFPGESSSAAEWAQRPGFPNWPNHQLFNSEISSSSSSTQDGKGWSSEPDTKLLYRTSSHPEPRQQYPNPQFSSDPIRVPKTQFPSHPHLPHRPGGNQMPLPSPNFSSLPNHQFQLSALPEGSQFTGNIQGYINPQTANQFPRNQWTGQSNMLLGKRSNSYNDLLQQQLPRPSSLINPQLIQNRSNHPFQQPYGLYNHQFCPPMNRLEGALGLGDLRDQRTRSLPKVGQGNRYFQQPFDNRSGWPQFRSKHMSSDEIENILRMQLAATHSNDPYIDDYYHQACLAKKSSGAKLKHHFCPSHLRDLPPHGRASSEPHAYLQVDALGRVAFPSIRRPRPLLEVDPPNSSIGAEHNLSEKPLEQEPLLAARVAIEDGLCLLLDVDDIDRFVRFNQPLDGGAHLLNRRQVLLDELAASLQLTDPLEDQNLKDDLVFLRVVSLPKGRKLLSKYLLLLPPNSELIRVVSMAVFRNLRFLFGNPITSSDLVKNVSYCVAKMELKALSACLASAVYSSEHPPLRPIGSPAGDGGSVILKSVLERATEILTNPNESGNCTGPNRALWQASFDSFFELLTKYCFNKYDSVMQSYTIDMGVIGPDVARAISREMPVELLRASLPHTNENQKKVLIDFARRSMPVNNGE